MAQYYVYILHTDTKLANHAQHYCGATSDLLGRLVAHAKGHGACITQAFRDAGIKWRVASVFVTRHRTQYQAERRIKRWHSTCVFCGICSGDEIKCVAGVEAIDLSLLGIPLTSDELAAYVEPPASETHSDDEIPY